MTQKLPKSTQKLYDGNDREVHVSAQKPSEKWRKWPKHGPKYHQMAQKLPKTIQMLYRLIQKLPKITPKLSQKCPEMIQKWPKIT